MKYGIWKHTIVYSSVTDVVVQNAPILSVCVICSWNNLFHLKVDTNDSNRGIALLTILGDPGQVPIITPLG